MDSPAKLEDWSQVLQRLVGLRLRVYDDVVRLGAHADDWEMKGTAHHTAVEWLVEHRLLERSLATGAWRAVPLEEAREKYQTKGAGKFQWKLEKPQKEETAEMGKRPTQAHQAQFLDLEGYQ